MSCLVAYDFSFLKTLFIGHDLSLIANWPDDLNLIRAVGEETYLGDVRIFEPDVFNTQGIRIHPSMYEQYLRPGTRVAVKVAHKLYVLTIWLNA